MKQSASEGDEDLAARSQRGDRRAFETLIGRHKEKLYAFVRRYVGSADDGYDVLQETFISAWLGLRRYDPGRPFLPWLRAIALNKCRDFGRRQTVRRLIMHTFIRENVGEPSTEAADQARDEESALTARLSRLDHAIAALPALYKEPLLLTTVSGLSHKEAAELLETTPKAIEMRLARARRRLMVELREDRRGDRESRA